MHYKFRLNQIKKKLAITGKKPIHIKVNHLENREFEKSYAINKARKKLNLISINAPRVILVDATDELEQKYQNLSVETATKIINEGIHES